MGLKCTHESEWSQLNSTWVQTLILNLLRANQLSCINSSVSFVKASLIGQHLVCDGVRLFTVTADGYNGTCRW